MKRLACLSLLCFLLAPGCNPAETHSIPDDPNAPAGEKSAEQSKTGRFQEDPNAPKAKASASAKAKAKNDLGDEGAIKSR